MMLKIFHNELDASEFAEHFYTCLLTEWIAVREQYPQARLYKGTICVQNDITPKTKLDAWALKDVTGDYQVLCHAGTPLAFGIIAAVISVGAAVYTYMNMPEMNAPQDIAGSPNNSLAQRQNKHRVNERAPDIYGKRKVVPDLISTVYRYYEGSVQVEECLLSIGTGSFAINEDMINEGETPINTIDGASISIYEPGQSTISPNPQIQIGSVFDKLQIVTKQVSAIDGKQTLLSPNSARISTRSVTVNSPNEISVPSDTINESGREWNDDFGAWVDYKIEGSVDFSYKFTAGEKVTISNAIYGTVEDIRLSGNTNVAMDGVLTIATSIDVVNPDNYKRVRIASLLINDPVSGALDLAGEYDVASITKSGSSGAYFYEVTLSDSFAATNPSFSLLTEDAVALTASVLTGNSNNVDLSGTYTVASTNGGVLKLVNPVATNADWGKVDSLTAAQKQQFLSRQVLIKGSKDNFIGWYYAGSKDSTGFILNFLAQNGIYDGDDSKQVTIEVEYQMVVDGVPTGQIYRYGDVMQGVANNRNPIGLSIRKELPQTGQFRFRVKRENDNGDSASLIDDVVFESAYSYYETKKSVYEHDTIVRLRRMAIGSGTNASELNMIAHRKLDTPNGFLPTSNFADISIAMARDAYIGRMDASEVDSQSFYDISNEIAVYFGTDKACEFNYTFDDKYASYQEMIFTVAEAVFCTARREGGLHYFSFERETPNSLALFNHRNIAPESMVVTEFFGIQDNYDGVELKWRDPSDNYSEAIIRLPDELRTNYKTIDSQGVTNYAQAHFLAHRAWNKLRYNRKAIEFTAYGEGDLVTRMDRIAIVDSTVPILCSGQVEYQENTVLTLDYPVELDASKSYVIHLQLKNSTVDVIEIVRQIGDHQIELARIPMMALVTSGVTHAVFNITEATEVEADAYLVSEKTGKGIFESTISAMAYDGRYYPNDKDYINGLIA
ncbi:host specificity factor TipJ family phage tail protein [Psychrobacter immobilis]|uniref:host specificity factor TipJ family phage tail protein n=1 Tax=Psychrobacter immobilis TaxID=498 RepID=UPI00191B7D55|nr:host specificity factor TipJ family phage tail protein [Psychrobacter immobilis]